MATTLYEVCLKYLHDYLAAGNSKVALAARLGVPPQHIKQILAGEGRYINLENLDAWIKTSDDRQVSRLLLDLLSVAVGLESGAFVSAAPATKIPGTSTAVLASGDVERRTKRDRRSLVAQEDRPSARKRVRLVKKQRP